MTDPFKEAEATRKVLTAPEDAEGRIDAWLAATLAGDYSRSRIKALIEEGAAVVNGAVMTEPKRKVHPGDVVEFTMPAPRDPAKLMELADIQSISAAIQNMCLEATNRNIGSLWTCNVFFAYDELKEWLHEDGEMAAAIAFGYTDKEVRPLPRKPMDQVVEYRGDYPDEWKDMLK